MSGNYNLTDIAAKQDHLTKDLVAAVAENNNELATLKSTIVSMNTEIETLKSIIVTQNTEIETLKSTVETLQNKMMDLELRLTSMAKCQDENCRNRNIVSVCTKCIKT